MEIINTSLLNSFINETILKIEKQLEIESEVDTNIENLLKDFSGSQPDRILLDVIMNHIVDILGDKEGYECYISADNTISTIKYF